MSMDDFRIEDGVLEKYVGRESHVTIPDGVTGIGWGAFRGCNSLTNVTIPDGVTSIGWGAFRGCSSLTNVTIPASVTSIESWAFEGCSSLTNVTIPDSVTSIEQGAFAGCSSLTNVTIPDGVTSIERNVFEGCSSLTNVTIPDSVTSIEQEAFEGCSSLTNVTIPDGVTSIGWRAFAGCSSLTNVTIQDGVTSIGERAFEGCSNLTDVTIPDGVTSIGIDAFKGCNCIGLANKDGFVILGKCLIEYRGEGGHVTVPNGMICIGDGAFEGCSSLTNVTIPDGVTSIGKRAFEGCSNLTDVTIPDGVTSIGWRAFEDCSNLTRVTIPKSVISIENNAFYGCDILKEVHYLGSISDWCRIGYSSVRSDLLRNTEAFYIEGRLLTEIKSDDLREVDQLGKYAFASHKWLRSVTIPEGVISIGSDAFNGCRGLTEITIPDSVTKIENGSFKGCTSLTKITIPKSVTSIENDAFQGCTGLTEITIPESVTSIGSDAFNGCTGLTGVVIAKNVTSIENGAFEGCTGLREITIPESVTSIENGVFRGCMGLTEITIPNSVTSIGEYAFNGCTGLTEVMIPENVTSIGAGAFQGCASLTEITVPENVTSIGAGAFQGCASLTEITVPENVTSIGGYAFNGCTGLTEVIIPENVISIGPGAFQGCASLTEITVPESVTTIEPHTFFNCGNLEHISVSVNTIISVFAFESDFSYKGSIPEKLHDLDFWSKSYLNHRTGKHLSESAQAELAKEPERAFETMVTLVGQYKGTAALKKAAEFYAVYHESISSNLLEPFYAACGKNKKLLSTIRQYIARVETASGNSSSEMTEAEEYCSKTFKAADLDKVMLQYSLSRASFEGVKYKDSDDQANPFVTECAVLPYAERADDSIYEVAFIPEADEAAKWLDQASLSAKIGELIRGLKPLKARTFWHPYCRYADEQQISDLIPYMRSSNEWSGYTSSMNGLTVMHGPSGRAIAKMIYAGLLLSDTHAAMLHVEKEKLLDRYARLRGTDADTIRDCYLSNVGLDERGEKHYDLGSRHVIARMNNELAFTVELENGKTAKSLPKKGADPVLYESAKADFDNLKKQVKKITKSRNGVLFEDFLSGRSREAKDWKAAYLNNVLLRRVASLLVWEQAGNTFTLNDSGIIDCEGNAYSITEEPIWLAHPMKMEKADVRKWQKYFTSHGLKQPFSQIWEPVCDLDHIREDRYAGVMIPYYRFVGQSKHGIFVDDQDFHNYINVSLRDCNADIDRIDYQRHWINMDDRFEIKTIQVRRKSRMANHIIAYFDKVTIWGRVRNDDVSIMNSIGDFTMAQISEFIKAAQESEAKNVLAMLLEYNNTAFADFDPMDEFTLE